MNIFFFNIIDGTILQYKKKLTNKQLNIINRHIKNNEIKREIIKSDVTPSTSKGNYVDPRVLISFTKNITAKLQISYSSAQIIKNNWALLTPKNYNFYQI